MELRGGVEFWMGSFNRFEVWVRVVKVFRYGDGFLLVLVEDGGDGGVLRCDL